MANDCRVKHLIALVSEVSGSKENVLPTMSIRKVVAITGCDSGLGLAIAARMARDGLVTVAGMYNGTETKAAQSLKGLLVHPRTLDVTKQRSVEDFKDYVVGLLKDNPDYRLFALVNNAGVMTIGDYEWQTSLMIENQINVNVLGTIRVISSFLPDLRRTALEGAVKPRIVNVASHCGLRPLPGFAPYSASKAAKIALTKSLRLEHRPHGLCCTTFIPGGFIGSSNLVAAQTNNFQTMLENLDQEQKDFYGKRITALSEYLRPVTELNSELSDTNIIETFMKTLTDENPKRMYKVESLRYKIYYTLMKLHLPESLHCWIIKKFVNFPDA